MTLHSLRNWMFGLLVATASLVSLTGVALGHGRGHHGGFGHRGFHGGYGGGFYGGYGGFYGGNRFYGFSPYGFGYGYRNSFIGLQIGPYMPLGYGGYGYGGFGYGGYGYGGLRYAGYGYGGLGYCNYGYGGYGLGNYVGYSTQYAPYISNTLYSFGTPYAYTAPAYCAYVQPTMISQPVVVERPIYPITLAPERPVPKPDVQTVAYKVNVSVDSIIKTNEGATPFQIEAEKAFREKNYERAAKLNGHALIEDRENVQLNLFASQCLFALEDYRGAAIAIAQVMSTSESKDWGYVIENFRRFYTDDAYVKQMAQLVQFNKDNPDAGYGFALRGYHYLFLGHRDAAKVQLEKALKIQPKDPIAQKLLDLIEGKQPTETPVPDPKKNE